MLWWRTRRRTLPLSSCRPRRPTQVVRPAACRPSRRTPPVASDAMTSLYVSYLVLSPIGQPAALPAHVNIYCLLKESSPSATCVFNWNHSSQRVPGYRCSQNYVTFLALLSQGAGPPARPPPASLRSAAPDSGSTPSAPSAGQVVSAAGRVPHQRKITSKSHCVASQSASQ